VLEELEERIEVSLYTDWVEAGERLAQIRDEELFRPDYASFREYLERRFNVHRATGYSYIQSSAVARDLATSGEDTRLPQRHCQLLYRFNTETRALLAPRIAGLSFREATRFVLDWLEDEGQARRRKPRHEPHLVLAALHRLLREIRALEPQLVEDARSQLDTDATRALDADLAAASRKLRELRRNDRVVT
jgi:hypothetical protein